MDGPVAVVDVDAHHGNGTQAIFYDDPDVLVGSVHVDPGAGWFPHFVGFADETGAGAGRGANRNVPLAPGAGDEEWLAARRRSGAVGARRRRPGRRARRRRRGRRPGEPAAGDGGRLSRRRPRAGRAAACPTVVVQEGGYDLDAIGALVHEFLTGLEEGADV